MSICVMWSLFPFTTIESNSVSLYSVLNYCKRANHSPLPTPDKKCIDPAVCIPWRG